MEFYIHNKIDKENTNLLEKHLADFTNIEMVIPTTDVKVNSKIMGKGFVLTPEKGIEEYNLPDSCTNVKGQIKENSVKFDYEGITYKLIFSKE